MVDKVKPLKIENPATGGTNTDPFPTETSPTQDYIAAKGFAFENSDSFLLDKIGRMISGQMPDTWQQATYLANGDLDYLEFFNSSSFITANRIAKLTLAYTSFNPTSATAVIYDTDGTTVLRTVTDTFTITSNVFQSVKTAVT
jgi:hypothetical protein